MTAGPQRHRVIVHVIQSVSATAGGPPVSSSRLAAARVRQGHRVRFLTENPDAPDAATQATPELEVHKVLRPGMREVFVRGPVRRRIAELLNGARVVYLHGVWDPLLLATSNEARLAGVPYVVVPVGMLDPWSLAQKRWKKRFALAFGVRRMLDGAATIRALNQDEASLLRPLGLRTPVHVIPNGVNFSEIDPPPPIDEFRNAVPGVSDRPFILFLSRLHYKKGLDILADAFGQVAVNHPNVQLVVAGADDGGRANFERRLSEIGIRERVHLPGPLYGRAKWAALVHAACFCLPSRQEGFSVAILEALASRVPVVITEGCHFPEVGTAGAGVVVPLDASAVAAGLDRILTHPSEAKAMGTAGRAMVEEHYTWDHVAEHCGALEQSLFDPRVPTERA